MSDVQVFDRVLAKEGYWAHIESDDNEIVQVLEHARRYADATVNLKRTKAGTPAPYVDVSDDEAIQAMAFREEDRDFLAIMRGAITSVNWLFAALLAWPSVMPEVGDTSQLLEPVPIAELPKTADDLPPRSILQDPARLLAASALAVLAKDFLIFHEIAHLWRAHCRKIGQATGRAVIREAGTGSASADMLLAQALEVDADSWAASTMAANIAAAVHQEGTYRKLAEALSWTPEGAVRYWLFAMCGLFELFPSAPLDYDNLAAEDHPHPHIRRVWIAQIAAGLADDGHLPLSKDECWELACRTAAEVEQAFSMMLQRPEESTDMFTDQDLRVDEHLERIRAKLRELADYFRDEGYWIEGDV